MNNSKWEICYRGSVGRWSDCFKQTLNPRDSLYEKKMSNRSPGSHSLYEKITSGLFKRYLEATKELNLKVAEINKLEAEVESTYLLLNLIPQSPSDSENSKMLDELIVYINSKEVM